MLIIILHAWISRIFAFYIECGRSRTPVSAISRRFPVSCKIHRRKGIRIKGLSIDVMGAGR